jgi:hypothetical protein
MAGRLKDGCVALLPLPPRAEFLGLVFWLITGKQCGGLSVRNIEP